MKLHHLRPLDLASWAPKVALEAGSCGAGRRQGMFDGGRSEKG